MKKIVFVGLLTMFLLTACAPTLTQFVQLNSQLQLLIEAVVVLVVGWAFVQIARMWPWFGGIFGKYQEAVAFALAAAVVGLVQDLLNLVPPGWETVGELAQVLLVAVLAALGVFLSLAKGGVRSFRD